MLDTARVTKAFDWRIHKKADIPLSGQIIDVSLAPEPKHRQTDGEQQAIKCGDLTQEIWPDDPANPLPMIALPVSSWPRPKAD